MTACRVRGRDSSGFCNTSAFRPDSSRTTLSVCSSLSRLSRPTREPSRCMKCRDSPGRRLSRRAFSPGSARRDARSARFNFKRRKMASSVSLGWTMMLMLERPKEARATGGCDVAPGAAGVVEVDAPPGALRAGPAVPAAVAPRAESSFATACWAGAAAGCRNSDGVRIKSQAKKAPHKMSAQRDGGRLRTFVTKSGRADLMGDGIDYTVRAPGRAPGWAGKCKERNRTRPT